MLSWLIGQNGPFVTYGICLNKATSFAQAANCALTGVQDQSGRSMHLLDLVCSLRRASDPRRSGMNHSCKSASGHLFEPIWAEKITEGAGDGLYVLPFRIPFQDEDMHFRTEVRNYSYQRLILVV
jgi:hypothetical protein